MHAPAADGAFHTAGVSVALLPAREAAWVSRLRRSSSGQDACDQPVAIPSAGLAALFATLKGSRGDRVLLSSPAAMRRHAHRTLQTNISGHEPDRSRLLKCARPDYYSR